LGVYIIKEVALISVILFSKVKVMFASILTQNRLRYILCDFFTNSSGHLEKKRNCSQPSVNAETVAGWLPVLPSVRDRLSICIYFVTLFFWLYWKRFVIWSIIDK
jgi:hypothetical protein